MMIHNAAIQRDCSLKIRKINNHAIYIYILDIIRNDNKYAKHTNIEQIKNAWNATPNEVLTGYMHRSP